MNFSIKARRPGRLAVATLGAVLAVTLVSCGPHTDSTSRPAIVTEVDADAFHGTVVDPPLKPAPVTLRDTNGNAVHLDQLSEPRGGTATAVFFGFTNCHDVCPTTMADLAASRRTLPAATADDVSVVFVTVDPRRDTAPVLRRWLDQFDPGIVGLRGPVQRVHRAEDSLYASQSSKTTPAPEDPEADSSEHEHPDGGGHTHPDGDPNGYAMDHTSVVYLFGPDGTTLIYTGGATPPDYAADLARLLGS